MERTIAVGDTVRFHRYGKFRTCKVAHVGRRNIECRYVTDASRIRAIKYGGEARAYRVIIPIRHFVWNDAQSMWLRVIEHDQEAN